MGSGLTRLAARAPGGHHGPAAEFQSVRCPNTEAGAIEGSSRWSWPAVAAISVGAVPLAVLGHEAGHLIGYFVFDFPSPVLHYASSAFEGEPEFWGSLRAGDVAGAASIVDIWAAGISAGLGLLVSYCMIGFPALAPRQGASTPAACLGVAAAARFPLVLLLVALGRAEHTDEAHVSQALGIPLTFLIILAGVALVAAVVGPYRRLPEPNRGKVMLAMVGGSIVGTVLWMAAVGPALLP